MRADIRHSSRSAELRNAFTVAQIAVTTTKVILLPVRRIHDPHESRRAGWTPSHRGLVLAGLWLAVAVVLRYKRVRRAQRKSEARAEAILETAADGIMTLAADRTIASFNPAAEDIFGYRGEEIVGEHVERLVAPR